MTSTPELLSNFVGGRFQEGSMDKGIPSINPSDSGDTIGLVPEGSLEDVDRAVEAAAEAFPDWRRLPGPARANHLYNWANVIEDRKEGLAEYLSREVGKPIGEATGEVGRCVVLLRYYAGEAVRSKGDVVPAQPEGALQFTLFDPLGVVGLITPWNFPAAIPLWKAAPALAFGNTVVVKPAEASSGVAVRLAETAKEAGLPAGAFNVLLGNGAVVGEGLVRHEEVRGVSFTGSVAVGSQVARICAERNVRYQTEMGGKNVVIVMPDADLDLAARLTAAGAMRYAGQKCTATSRAVISSEVEGSFMAKLQAEVDSLVLGPVSNPRAGVGPLIDEAARDRVLAAISEASAGAVEGGKVPSDSPLDRGFFIEPAVVRDADPSSVVGREELFGPVLATFQADTLEEALDLANQTRYGLSASLFTRDLATALEYMDQIEVGLVRVNGDTTGVDPHAPFGGLKASSSGTREQGRAARDFYTQIRTVQINR